MGDMLGLVRTRWDMLGPVGTPLLGPVQFFWDILVTSLFEGADFLIKLEKKSENLS